MSATTETVTTSSDSFKPRYPRYRDINDPPKSIGRRRTGPKYYLGWEFPTLIDFDCYYYREFKLDYRPVNNLRRRFISPRWEEFGYAEKFGLQREPYQAAGIDGKCRVFMGINVTQEEIEAASNRELIDAVKHVLHLKTDPRWIRLT